MVDLTSRRALVTAGARGLGAEIVRQLAECGADVAFTYLKDGDAAAKLEKQVGKSGRRVVGFQADAADFQAAHRVVAGVREQLGGLEILVCNAGIARSVALLNMAEDDWDAVINVSLKGAFNYIRAAAPLFAEQSYGKVVAIGSINGLRGRVGSTSYNSAKAGLVGLVKTAAAELGRHGVNVNLVAPGFIDTPSQRNTPELIRDLVLDECAIKHLGQPEDISPLVAFLCSDQSRHITGQTIKVDGGQYL